MTSRSDTQVPCDLAGLELFGSTGVGVRHELAEWPSPRVLELLEETGASDEQAMALRVRAVQMQGEFFVAWTRAGADRD